MPLARSEEMTVEAAFGLSLVAGTQMNMETPGRRLVCFSGEIKVDQIRTGAVDVEVRGQLDFSGRACWLCVGLWRGTGGGH